MRATHAIWTVFTFLLAVITIIVVMRYVGVSVRDVTDALSAGLEYVGKMLKLFKV